MTRFLLKGWALVVVLVIPALVNGQARDSLKTKSIGFTPQYLAQQALRFDFEHEIGKNRNRAVLRPYLYRGTTYLFSAFNSGLFDGIRNRRDRNEVRGWGVELAYKYRLTKTDKYVFPYLEGGLGYHHVNLTFENPFGWRTFQEDGLEVFRQVYQGETERVRRFDAFAVIGYRAMLTSYFCVDLYVGGTLRSASITSTTGRARNHQEFFVMHGFEGAMIRLGATLSFML